jgi:hypothetical protein
MCQRGNCPFSNLKNLKVYKMITFFKGTVEIETGMAGKYSWDQANRRQKLGLVWRIRNKN